MIKVNYSHTVTWYSHCYNYTCPDGQKIVTPNTKMVGSIEGTHKCYDGSTSTYSGIIKTINYDQCGNNPCNELDGCKGFAAGQQQCLSSIQALANE